MTKNTIQQYNNESLHKFLQNAQPHTFRPSVVIKPFVGRYATPVVPRHTGALLGVISLESVVIKALPINT
ncbi:hypothetical protein HanPSC8_Chr02g0055411 [Helianthus annuus]|nr:hypothetical protein HanPSC8_Chr02g0055411 [Helianthus annuus]